MKVELPDLFDVYKTCVTERKGAFEMIPGFEETRGRRDWQRKAKCLVLFECGMSERNTKPVFHIP